MDEVIQAQGAGERVGQVAWPTYRHLFSREYDARYAVTYRNPLRVIAHCDVDAAYAQCTALLTSRSKTRWA